jgi:hypothetical protein
VLRVSDEEELLLAEDVALGRKVWVWLRPASWLALPENRRQLARTMRSRWLACGVQDSRQWDAFLAPTGCRLREAVANLGRFSWPESRPLLEELAEELAIAAEEGTLPETLDLDQVWVQPDGRLYLVDVFLAHEASAARGGQRGALELLGQTAALVLEGAPRPRDAEPGPMRAPLPLHVSRFLGRLLGWPEPYREVKEFQAVLSATREQPQEVQRVRRSTHLVLLAALLLPAVLFLCLPPILGSPRVYHVVALSEKHHESRQIREFLHRDASSRLAGSLASPDPRVRLQGASLWAHDQELQRRLQEKQAQLLEEYETWHGTLYGPAQLWADSLNLFLTSRAWTDFHQALGKTLKPATVRSDAQRILSADLRPDVEGDSVRVKLVWMGIWILPLVIWAFLTRGGLSYQMVGIHLVRANGRPAARWQCAVRALLFWLPVYGLFAASVALDWWFWSLGDPQPGGLLGWLPRLAFGAWLGGLLLLPAYAVLALRSPARSLHDRLVGTYLVPR